MGILSTGLFSAWLLGPDPTVLWLVAPMGASAVLLFAVPASPLAQPWSIVGGNLVSALIGVSCAKWLGAPVLAAAGAVSLAIAAMFMLRCIHPPSGAVALTAVLGGPQVHLAGFGFVWLPVGLNTVLLLATALVYNRLVGRRYPHSQHPEAKNPHQTHDQEPMARLGFEAADLAAALRDYNQVLDVSADDLEALFLRTEMKAYQRRFGALSCGRIMSRDVLTVEYATELEPAWQLMEAHAVHALPVLDRSRRVIGIVTRADFLAQARLLGDRHMAQRLRRLLRRTPRTHSDKPEVVGQIMSAQVQTVFDTTAMVELVPLMSARGWHHVPVVNAERRLVGMVTQTDLVAALFEASFAPRAGDGAGRAENAGAIGAQSRAVA